MCTNCQQHGTLIRVQGADEAANSLLVKYGHPARLPPLATLISGAENGGLSENGGG
jgi:hypothetical protein